MFPASQKSCAYGVGAYSNTRAGFLPRAPVKPLDQGKWLFANRRHVSLIQVRKNRVRAYLDDNLIAESNHEDLGDKHWSTRNPRFIGVAQGGNVTYHSIEIYNAPRNK